MSLQLAQKEFYVKDSKSQWDNKGFYLHGFCQYSDKNIKKRTH